MAEANVNEPSNSTAQGGLYQFISARINLCSLISVDVAVTQANRVSSKIEFWVKNNQIIF